MWVVLILNPLLWVYVWVNTGEGDVSLHRKSEKISGGASEAMQRSSLLHPLKLGGGNT
jgi:hypothetical protein